MKMLAYFDTVPSADLAIQQRLMNAWQKAWQARGWESHVICEHHARTSTLYQRMLEWLGKLPSTNPALTKATFVRWLAAAEVLGNNPGFLAHYDVFPHAQFHEWYRKKSEAVLYHPEPVLVAGTGPAFLAHAARLMEGDYAGIDVPQDKHFGKGLVIDRVKNVGEQDETTPVIHYARDLSQIIGDLQVNWPKDSGSLEINLFR